MEVSKPADIQIPSPSSKVGRPRKGEIRKDLYGLSPEEQMKRDVLIEKRAPDDGYLPFTYSSLHELSRLPKSDRRNALKALGMVEWNRCAKDFMYWIDASRHALPYVYTLDPRDLYTCNHCIVPEGNEKNAWTQFNVGHHLESTHDVNIKELSADEIVGYFTKLAPIRPTVVKDYFEPIYNAWLTEPFIVCEKSRDMMATWLFSFLFTWGVLYKEGQQYVFQSDDTEKTRELVEKRAFFIWDHQPDFLKNVHPAKFEVGLSKGGRLYVPSLSSEIIGLAQGADQIRYLHPAGIFIDEGAFHAKLEYTVGAVKPAIQKGGRISIVSSVNPGFFQALSQDFSQ